MHVSNKLQIYRFAQICRYVQRKSILYITSQIYINCSCIIYWQWHGVILFSSKECNVNFGIRIKMDRQQIRLISSSSSISHIATVLNMQIFNENDKNRQKWKIKSYIAHNNNRNMSSAVSSSFGTHDKPVELQPSADSLDGNVLKIKMVYK